MEEPGRSIFRFCDYELLICELFIDCNVVRVLLWSRDRHRVEDHVRGRIGLKRDVLHWIKYYGIRTY